MSCCRENSPRGFAQVRDYDTFLIYYCEYRFHIFFDVLSATVQMWCAVVVKEGFLTLAGNLVLTTELKT